MKLNQPLVLAAALAATLGTSALNAQKADSLEEAELLMALPELSEPAAATRASAGIRCFVDTPALDPWMSPNCFKSGTAFTTSAVFDITNAPSNFTILWSDSRCGSSSTSTTCILPISQFQQLSVTATVLNNDNGTFVQLSSTARYEGFQ